MIGPPVYVFTAGEVGQYGLTLLRDASNLPPPEDARARWTLFQEITLADDDLFPFAENVRVARAQLTLRTFYLSRVSANILPFPKTLRHSA
jgi:hypothetical protein